ncbi:Gfo/Idh/MocA family protein [Gorillibacterium massiliense]|uniref:Gfo/Idh/MocA family protein n=1 Tax=Gorillibacterium massiliense TaxID=1280390 RepID=UPI00059532ED|nr:Gfo/Idh/MocA family oxidoreductase [Gorillibacterium massiliense]
MKSYGIVLVGCGSMGATHLDTIATHPQVRLVGVADLIPDKAKDFAVRYHAESWSANYKEYLLRDDVDIVIIATYPSTHLDITRNCLAAGKHVLCEKPMAGTLKDAAEMVRLGSSAKSKLLIGHILRHNATYQQVQKLIQKGEIGHPIVMRMSQLKNTSATWSSHLALLEQVSPIVDCGVHYVDVMRWFTGAEVMSISGVGQRLEPDVPFHTYNYGMIAMRFTDGSAGYYEAGWGHTMPQDNLKEFIGPKGRIRITYRRQRSEADKHLGNLVEIEYSDGQKTEMNIPFNSKPTDLQLEYLIRMIELNLDPTPYLRDFYRALEITLRGDQAIHESMTVPCMDAPVAEAANY